MKIPNNSPHTEKYQLYNESNNTEELVLVFKFGKFLTSVFLFRTVLGF